jgi:uncharacterized protein YutE (UPF0331/DUF86 family)
VHRYWQIEPDLVLKYARENLEDFELFLQHVGRFVGNEV